MLFEYNLLVNIINEIEQFLDHASDHLLGRRKELHLALLAVVSHGHLLIEDQPGMGKTVLAHLLARLLGRPLTRIQFTNDLLPADILGGPVWVKDEATFVFQPGPIFAEMILADELNRASPKTQSALLQAMEEGAISMEGVEHNLASGFCVIATQNPYEQVGTHPLPESQLDRFTLGITLEMPERELEKKILVMADPREKILTLTQCLDRTQVNQLREASFKVVTSEPLLDYVLDLITALRRTGAHVSPRAGQDLITLARLQAVFCGRSHTTPDDIQFVAAAVLGHRVGGAKGMKVGQHEVRRLVAELSIP